MTIPLKFILDVDAVSVLGRLHGAVTLRGSIEPPNGLTRLWLSSGDDVTVSLTVNFDDVVFTFEIFSLAFKISPLAWLPSEIEIGHVRDWEAIKCLFRYEWERPAFPGEIPPHYVQAVREGGGQRSDIPSTILSLGVSMTGIAFWNVAQNKPIAVVMSDHENAPITMRVCDNDQEMEAAIAGTESIDLKDLEHWSAQLRQYLSKFAG